MEFGEPHTWASYGAGNIGVQAAIVAAAVIAWFIGAPIGPRLPGLLNFSWLLPFRLVLLLVLLLFVVFLPSLIFQLGWIVFGEKHTSADAVLAGYFGLIPAIVALISSAVHFRRSRRVSVRPAA